MAQQKLMMKTEVTRPIIAVKLKNNGQLLIFAGIEKALHENWQNIPEKYTSFK